MTALHIVYIAAFGLFIAIVIGVTVLGFHYLRDWLHRGAGKDDAGTIGVALITIAFLALVVVVVTLGLLA